MDLAHQEMIAALESIRERADSVLKKIEESAESGVRSKYLTFASSKLVHSNGFNSSSMVGINSVTVG
jgi:hypothetical protein